MRKPQTSDDDPGHYRLLRRFLARGGPEIYDRMKVGLRSYGPYTYGPNSYGLNSDGPEIYDRMRGAYIVMAQIVMAYIVMAPKSMTA